MLGIISLGSGSSGNSSVIYSERTSILVDAGLSAMQLKKRITLSGLNPNELNAVLITHEHTDHTKGLEVLSKTVSVPVYCNSLTHEAIAGANGSVKSWKLFENGNPFMIGDIEVCGFSVMHDAADPVGFTFERNDNKIGFISDVGHVNQLLISSVKDVQNLFIEANYDETLLQNDNKSSSKSIPIHTEASLVGGLKSPSHTKKGEKQLASPLYKVVVEGSPDEIVSVAHPRLTVSKLNDLLEAKPELRVKLMDVLSVMGV